MARKRTRGPGRRVHPAQKVLSDGRRRRRFVRSLQQFLRAYGHGEEGAASRQAFAQRCDTSLAYLVQLGLGYRVASMEMAIRVERATHGLVRAEDLHPSPDWDYLDRRKRITVSGASSTTSA